MTTSANQFFAVVPAAGAGSRMQADCPKQYLSVQGKTILEHTLSKLLSVTRLQAIVVAVSDSDDYWRELAVFSRQSVFVANGGAERCDSVLNGLLALADMAKDDDWVLVHDVARPCVKVADVDKLIEQLQGDPVGGILAVPASDTLKRVGGNTVEATIDRSIVWQAQTPQMFRYKVLRDALTEALEQSITITDEASAIESAGLKVKVVEGSRDNIKVTRPEDLALAAYFLQAGNQE
jgi:2-C-methyl-D-erythritol 4-phosphate cytidylyltransferase